MVTSPNVSEIITTTLESRTRKLADTVTANTALLRRLREKGNVKPFSGGRLIYQELQYQMNSTYQRYSGYDPINISPSDVISAAQYTIAQASVAVTMSGLEQLENSGKEQMIDLIAGRIENAEATMVNNIASDCYSSGTLYGQIGGMQLLVSSTPTTGTVGGINRTNFSFWQNAKFSGSSDGGSATSSSNVQNYMNQLWMKLVRNTDRPDLIVADNVYWNFYLVSLQGIQRIMDINKPGQVGFTSLKYMDADVMLDGGYSGFAPSSTMYFVNSKYLFFRPHRDRNFVVQPGDRVPVNQDAIVKLLLWAGNLTMSNAWAQGVFIA